MARLRDGSTTIDQAILYLTSGATWSHMAAGHLHAIVFQRWICGPYVCRWPQDSHGGVPAFAHIAQRIVIELLPMRAVSGTFSRSCELPPYPEVRLTLMLAPPRMGSASSSPFARKLRKRPPRPRRHLAALVAGIAAARYRREGTKLCPWHNPGALSDCRPG